LCNERASVIAGLWYLLHAIYVCVKCFAAFASYATTINDTTVFNSVITAAATTIAMMALISIA
jgi:hypothetical protein